MPSPLMPPPIVFDRVAVDYQVRGPTRVRWSINSHFQLPSPWTFQLQCAEANVLPTASSNWVDVGPPLVNVFETIDNEVKLPTGKEQLVFYRVVLTTADNQVFYSPIAAIYGDLDFKSNSIANEIVRKEDLRHRRLKASVEGYILKARRSGTPCPVCLDPRTGEVTDSKCPTCFGTRWEGGFFAPMPAVYGDLGLIGEVHLRRDLQVDGMVMPFNTRARFLAAPFITAYDVWVNKTSDDRYFIHPYQVVAQIRGVPLIIDAELRRIPYDDIVYRVPVPRS